MAESIPSMFEPLLHGFDYVLDAIGKAADVVGKTADAAAKVADTAAKHAADGAKVASNTVPDDGTKGASAAGEKANKFKKARQRNSVAGEKAKKLEQARQRYEEFRKVMRVMLRNSVKTKLNIMVPAYGLLWVFPQHVFESPLALTAFTALGVHMGIEATEQLLEKFRHAAEHQLTKIRSAQASLTLKNNEIREQNGDQVHIPTALPKHTTAQQIMEFIRDTIPSHAHTHAHDKDESLNSAEMEASIIADARKKDRVTTGEITGAILGSIYDLPHDEQFEIMGLFGIVMLSSYYLVGALVRFDYAGQKLIAWETSETSFDKFLEKTKLSERAGHFLQLSVHNAFVVLPWIGAIAKFATVGRIGWHVVEGAGYLPHHSLDHHAIAERLLTWGAYGLAASIGLYVTKEILKRAAYTPLKQAIKNSPNCAVVTKTFRDASVALLMQFHALKLPQKDPQGFIKCTKLFKPSQG